MGTRVCPSASRSGGDWFSAIIDTAYDDLDSGDFAHDFAFTRGVGEAFLDAYPTIVRTHMNEPWSATERQHQLVRRGRYVEFNLLHDRGTKFGLMTGGNVEAILMSLPPEVRWP